MDYIAEVNHLDPALSNLWMVNEPQKRANLAVCLEPHITNNVLYNTRVSSWYSKFDLATVTLIMLTSSLS